MKLGFDAEALEKLSKVLCAKDCGGWAAQPVLKLVGQDRSI